MEPIASPLTNTSVPDTVLAQTVASDSDWQMNAAGQIFDERGVIISMSLNELGRAMRFAGWFTPVTGAATGVDWKALPHSDQRADKIRHLLR